MKHAVALLGAVLWLAGCGERAPGPYSGAGTARMAERLEFLAANLDPQQSPYEGPSRRLEQLRTVEPPADHAGGLQFRARRAQELLHAGRIEEAIAGFEGVLRDARSLQVAPTFTLAVLESLAIAYLKLWEQENCVAGRSTRSCLFPIDVEGDAVRSDAALAATKTYELLLQIEPENLAGRWLLNLAYMQLGRHPRGVPAASLIAPETFRSEYDVGRFNDIAAELGLDVVSRAGGSIMDDFDRDGDLDLMVSSWHLSDQLRFFVNDGDGGFSERTAEAGLTGLVGGLNLKQADYDNDGQLDVYVLRGAWLSYGQPNSLLRNNGDGTFEDVTEAAGMLFEYSTQTAAWGDFDDDGWVDLYVGNESMGARRNPNQLFHNNGDGTFTDIAPEAGAAVVGFVKAVVAGDVNNDGRLDLYISRIGEPNVLLRNEGVDAAGRLQFADVTSQAGVGEPIFSFPAWFWDYDNDGWLDVFVSGWRRGKQSSASLPGHVAADYLGLPHEAETPRLYRNNGDGTFSDVTRAAHVNRVLITMGSNYGDLDGDGFQDFYAGTGDPDFRLMIPNRMFRNDGGRGFLDVTTSGGFGHLQKGHAVSFGDLDGDGDQDIHATLGGAFEGDLARNALFENPGHGNHWITLRLEGARSNRAAIGARVKASIETSEGRRHVYSTVTSGGSFGANSLQQEIGLGRAVALRSIEIYWPTSGTTDAFTDVEMDRIYRVREGDSELTPILAQPIDLGGSP